MSIFLLGLTSQFSEHMQALDNIGQICEPSLTNFILYGNDIGGTYPGPVRIGMLILGV